MCDSVVVFTEDGPLFAKNSDRDPNEAQRVTWHPAADHAAGSQVSCTWSTIDQAAHTYAVMLSRPWWMWGAEMGANEHCVVIGNEAVFTRRAPRRRTGTELLGMDLVRLGLERARSAGEAVQVIVGLVERHGQGGACSYEHPRFTYDNSFLIVDGERGFVLETAGHAWAVEEVTSGVRAISNGLSIPTFTRRYADPVRGFVARHVTRRQAVTECARGARNAADMANVLRRHEGVGPVWRATAGALGGPCAHAGGLLTSTQTTGSWVADLRTGRHWVTGAAAPCTATFVPVRVDQPVAALHGPEGLTNRYDPAHHWWRHEVGHRALLRDWERAASVRAERDALERAAFEGADADDVLQALGSAQQRWLRAWAAVPDVRPKLVRVQWQHWNRNTGVPII